MPQTPGAAGSQTQTWPLTVVRAGTPPGPPHVCAFLIAVKSPVLPFSSVQSPQPCFPFISPLPTLSSLSFHNTFVHHSGACSRCLGVFLWATLGQCGWGVWGWPIVTSFFFGYNDLGWMCANKSRILFVYFLKIYSLKLCARVWVCAHGYQCL